MSPEHEFLYRQFHDKIAAGLEQGDHQAVAWQDAWTYKCLETACYIYASTGDESLLARMDSVISIIAKAQEDDGFIATQVTAGKFAQRWICPDNHELYNMRHLLSATAYNETCGMVGNMMWN